MCKKLSLSWKKEEVGMEEVEILDPGEETRTEIWKLVPETNGWKDVTVSSLMVVFEEGRWIVKADRRGTVKALTRASVLDIATEEVLDGNL